MASVTHLKGVRTRFRNVLEKNIASGNGLLQCDIENCDVGRIISETNKCIQSLQLYSDKLENHCEKVASAFEASDQTFVEQITEEDGALCAEALECSFSLQQHKDLLISVREQNEKNQIKSETSSDSQSEQLISLQRDMQRLFEIQIQQQEKLMDSKTNKSSSIKLPKLELISFSGDKTRWCEFWDSFKCSVHDNKTLSNSEKFNYLKSKVCGEAQRAISGLALSDANYDVAIGILRERFGNVQEVVDLHYNKLINLQPATTKTSSLRSLLDTVERHLRSLEVLDQNINQDVFVSMLRAKLPEHVLVQLEVMNGATNKWTIFKLRDRLRDYILARERAEKSVTHPENSYVKTHQVQQGYKRSEPVQPTTRNFTSSAHVLTVAKNKQHINF